MRSNIEIAQELRQAKRPVDRYTQVGRTYLFCPYADKEQVKALGADWDANKKQWYISYGQDAAPFARWLQRTEPKTSGKFLVSKKKKNVAHIWTGNDTACRMYSTGGMSKFKKSVLDTPNGRLICFLCESVSKNK